MLKVKLQYFLFIGLIWPIEGMPQYLRWFSESLPFTIPVQSMRNVMKKNWGFFHPDVFKGIAIEVVWIILLGIISGYLVKSKR